MERQITLSILGNRPVTEENIKRYAPKIYDLVNAIESLKGKHVVYSTFIQHGLHIVEKELQRRGWTRYDPNLKTHGGAKSSRQNKGAGRGMQRWPGQCIPVCA